MTQIEFNRIKEVIKAYKDRKDKLLQPLIQYRQDVKNGKRLPYFEDDFIAVAYSTLDDCSERKQFLRWLKKQW